MALNCSHVLKLYLFLPLLWPTSYLVLCKNSHTNFSTLYIFFSWVGMSQACFPIFSLIPKPDVNKGPIILKQDDGISHHVPLPHFSLVALYTWHSNVQWLSELLRTTPSYGTSTKINVSLSLPIYRLHSSQAYLSLENNYFTLRFHSTSLYWWVDPVFTLMTTLSGFFPSTHGVYLHPLGLFLHIPLHCQQSNPSLLYSIHNKFSS